ncbi:MAG: hypothetical protein LBH40_03760 [Alphaproteobacteria bacterium]|jgi:hypothetical protein|nr:hypothetical protein [Alphaproteobacteria bacterium]
MQIGINFYHYSLIILCITALAIIISSIFNKKLTETLATAIVLIVFYLYWFALFGILAIGYWSLLSFIIIGFLVCIFIKRKQLLSFISISFFAWVLLVFVIAIIFRDSFFYHWDDFSHWGTTLKDMFYTNEIIKRSFNDYPIGTRVFQYFILKIYGVYNESVALTYLYIIYFSFIIYPLAKIEKSKNTKRIGKYLLILFYGMLALLFPFGFDSVDLFSSLLVDFVQGMTFGFIIFIISNRKKFDSHTKLLLFLLLFFLVQIKIVGLMLAVAAVLLIILKDKNYKDYKNILFFISPVVLSKLSWFIYIKYYDYSNYLVNNLYSSETKSFVINSFISDYLQGLIKIGIFLHLSPFVLLLIVSALALYITIIHKDLRNNAIKFYLVFLALFIIYNFGLYSMYMKAFSSSEKMKLGGFVRYQTIIWGGVIFMLFLYIPQIVMRFKNHIVLLLVLNIFVAPFTIHIIYKEARYYKKDLEGFLRENYKELPVILQTRLNILKIKKQLPKDFINKNIVIFSDGYQRVLLRYETGNSYIFFANQGVYPNIIVIIDKEKSKQEIIDFIKLHKLNIKFKDITETAVINIP